MERTFGLGEAETNKFNLKNAALRNIKNDPFCDEYTEVKMKRLKLLLSISAFVIIANHSAFGCLCQPISPKKALKYWSDTVFSGKLIAIGNNNYFTFKTEVIWKGIPEKEIVIKDDNVGSSCGTVKYNIGEQYLVFANSRNMEDNKVFVDEQNNPIIVVPSCSWNVSLSNPNAKKILKKIGKGKPVN